MVETGVFIVDDHELVRQGLRSLIEAERNMKVVGEATSGEEALDAYLAVRPDVVVMDISMPGMSGIEATRSLLAGDPNARVVGLSMHADSSSAAAMREAGCLSFVNKASAFRDLVQAIHAASAGLSFDVGDCAGSDASSASENGTGLSSREQEVLGMIGHGYSNETIAENLNVGVDTVTAYRRIIMSKLRM